MDVLHTLKIFLDDLMIARMVHKIEISESPAFNSLTTALESMDQKTSIFIYGNSPNAHILYSPPNAVRSKKPLCGLNFIVNLPISQATKQEVFGYLL